MLTSSFKSSAFLMIMATVTGCGGSNGPSVDANKIKPKPNLQQSKYPQGLYLSTLAEDEGDIVRNGQSNAKYLGAAFAVEEDGNHEFMVMSVSNHSKLGQAEHLTIESELTVGGSKNSHSIDTFGYLCNENDGCGIKYDTHSGYADSRLSSLSSIHRSQIQSESFSAKYGLVFQDIGLTIAGSANPLTTIPNSLLFKVETDDWNTQSISTTNWQTLTDYSIPSKYNQYQLVNDGDSLSIRASIVDSGQSHCSIVATIKAKQADTLMFISKQMNPADAHSCLTYVQGTSLDPATKLAMSRVVTQNHTLLLTKPTSINGSDILAVMHLAIKEDNDKAVVLSANNWLEPASL